MAFPFLLASRLRQQLLIALGGTGLLTAALGCPESKPATDTLPAGGNRAQAGERAADPIPARAGVSGSAGRTSPGTGVAGTAGRSSSGAGAGGFSSEAGAAGNAGHPANAGMSGSLAVAGSSGSGAVMCELGGRPGEGECYTAERMKSLAKFGCGQIPISPEPTEAEIQAKFLPNGCLQRAAACNGCCNPAATDGVPQADGSCCYTYCAGSCCGRPFVVDGVAQLAPVAVRSDWAAQQPVASDPAACAARIAAEWLDDARMEHASIASFARFTLDLLAHGAPAELVELAQRAALDEVEHARLCFGLAARFSGRTQGPAPLTTAAVGVATSLWHAALAAFHEGCVAETLAALQAAAAFERAEDPYVRRALERIAIDEAKHAELAWRFVAWASVRLGEPFMHELQRALATLLTTPAPVDDGCEDAATRRALHAAGRLTVFEQREIQYSGLREVVAGCLATLVPQPAAAVGAC